MRVNDMEETLRFYVDVLGLTVENRKRSPRGSELVFLSVPNSDEVIEICSFPAGGKVEVPEDLVAPLALVRVFAAPCRFPTVWGKRLG